MESNDIVTRLRKEISKRDRPYPVELLPELREAADEIERLRAEVEELTDEKFRHGGAFQQFMEESDGR